MTKTMILAAISAFALYGAADVDVFTQRARTSLKQARSADSAAALTDAQDAVRQALALQPENREPRKLEVRVLLAQHRFAEAFEKAKPLNRDMPDDVEAWGLVSDAALNLGDYAEAERTAQWMLRLRSTNVGGLQRGARLRELFGDDDGAREFWQTALRLSLTDQEERAWLATQLASLMRRMGHAGEAEALLRQVLNVNPDYQPAEAEQARALVVQRKYPDAVATLEARYKKVTRPDVRFELAGALQLAGREAEAHAAYQEFERAALAVVNEPYNYNHELVRYYTDCAPNATEALRIAQIEAARRHDVDTLDAYAWALYKSGNADEARKQMGRALAVGTKEAAYLSHAETIAGSRKAAAGAE